MTPPLVSIVIPVFNVERHLRQCLDSVLRQTLKEWECICIDDGSPDGSGAILDEYGNRDARFKIIHQRNRGVSAARNLGIKLASAPYLTFIDSDDWVEDDALESLLSAMKESCADMVMCSICIHQENHQEVSMETPYPPSGNMRDEYAVTEKSFSGAALVDVSIWAKLFSAETIRAHQIHFAPELKVSEDMEFSTRMLCHSRRVSIIRKPLYHCRPRKQHYEQHCPRKNENVGFHQFHQCHLPPLPVRPLRPGTRGTQGTHYRHAEKGSFRKKLLPANHPAA